jgi:hypothetical protein
MRQVMNMNTVELAEQPMNTTILNYPGFPSLPKGVKQMLLASEAFFFDEPASHPQPRPRPVRRLNRGSTDFMGIKILRAGFPNPARA